jgi:hypothetical protein
MNLVRRFLRAYEDLATRILRPFEIALFGDSTGTRDDAAAYMRRQMLNQGAIPDEKGIQQVIDEFYGPRRD